MLARGVTAAIREKGISWPWGNVLPLLQNADLTLANLECVIGRKGNEFMPRRVFYFRADNKAADALSMAGIDFVSLANNHAIDFRGKGLMETRRLLDQKNITFTGAGKDQQQAQEIAFIDVKGIRVAMIAFADHFKEYSARKTKPGINYITVGSDTTLVKDLISQAKKEGADLIIFSMHWGPNMNRIPLPGFVEFAHAVIDAGVDIFHGHSAHVFQGIEFYNKGVILYDTGDLVDDYYVYPKFRNDQQLLFQINVSAEQIERVELIPLKISAAQVNLAAGTDFEEIYQRIKDLSLPFGTEVSKQDGRLIAYGTNKK